MLDTRGPRLPRIVHWGSDLAELSAQLLDNLAIANIQAAVSNVPDDDQVGHPGRSHCGAGVDSPVPPHPLIPRCHPGGSAPPRRPGGR